jgi:hypothetical protein
MKRRWKKLSPFGRQPLLVWGFYTAAVLCMSVSCKTKDPCPNSSCCGDSSRKLVYQQTIENAKADVLGGVGLVIENLKWSPLICPNQRDKWNSLKNTYSQPQQFKYRVSGKIYHCVDCPTNGIGVQVTFIYIDRIEMVN